MVQDLSIVTDGHWPHLQFYVPQMSITIFTTAHKSQTVSNFTISSTVFILYKCSLPVFESVYKKVDLNELYTS